MDLNHLLRGHARHLEEPQPQWSKGFKLELVLTNTNPRTFWPRERESDFKPDHINSMMFQLYESARGYYDLEHEIVYGRVIQKLYIS